MEVVSKKSTNRRIAREYKKLLKISYQDLNDNDVELLRDALDVAIDAHKDQYRKYIEEYQNQVINQADEHRWVLET